MDKSEQPKKVIVTSLAQRTFFGEVTEDGLKNLIAMEPVNLLRFYEIIFFDEHMVGEDGMILGIKRSSNLMSFFPGQGAMKKIRLLPASWFDPEECGMLEGLNELAARVEKAAEAARQGRGAGGPGILKVGAGALTALNQNLGMKDSFKKK